MMTLATGVRLGPYAILELLGSGGMGEVYRATDTRLDRIVAIKILPVHVAESPMRRQRWEREARAVSSLSHSHICALYDVGEQDGISFIVMEYLDGESLAQRLRRGPLPVDEALRDAIQMADALDHAHRHGLVHRDLKPANIMLTEAGAKLLDFGLATWQAPDVTVPPAPTRSTETLTDEGVIVGTVQYMAPEQLEAHGTDARTDIFAFGAVVHEMISGCRAFEATSNPGIMAAILAHDPPPASIARRQREAGPESSEPVVPSPLDHVVLRCLAKSPDERWQTASDVKRELQWIATGGSQISLPPAVTAARRWRGPRFAWVAAGVLFVMATLTMVGLLMTRLPRAPVNTQAYQFTVSPPEHATFNISSAFMTLSPDGHSLAFVASSPQGNNSLWVRSLDSLAARQLPGTDGAAQPFWSPDSRFLAFTADGLLKKIDVSRGLSQTLANVSLTSGAWNRDDVILFNSIGQPGLSRVPATGGTPTPATTLDRSRAETGHALPHFLPDGHHFVYLATSTRSEDDGILYVASLDSPERTPLFRADSQAVYAATGYLLYLRANTLLAQPFDPARLRVTGEAVPIAEEVERNTESRRGAFSVSPTGVLAYRPVGETHLVWFDRPGRRLESVGPPGQYRNPALSPDERRLAVARRDPDTGVVDIWLIELARGNASRLTSDPSDMPLWSPDGHCIVFRSKGNFNQKAVSGTCRGEVLLSGDNGDGKPLGWSGDGRSLVYETYDVRTLMDLWILPLVGNRHPVPFLQTGFFERQGQLSPDGRWIAYVSDESGKNEVYVRPFPSAVGKWRVSPDGGIEPQWRRDGKELFYLAPDRHLMSVAVRTASTFEARPPTRLFETRMSALINAFASRNQYVVTGDGQRFLVNQPSEETPSSSITVVVNWAAALKK